MQIFSAKDLIRQIEITAKTKRPLFIRGPPGIGKSEIVRETLHRMKYFVIDKRLAMEDPAVCFTGLPTVHLQGVDAVTGQPLPATAQGVTLFAKPDWLPVGPPPAPFKWWGFFFDELNLAEQLTQKAAYQLMWDGEISACNYKMPEGSIVIAAGNRLQDRCGVVPLPRALEGRFRHVEFFGPTVQEWVEWGSDHGIHPHILSFHLWMEREKGSILNAWNPDAQDPAQPTPRTWAIASDTYHVTGNALDVATDVGSGAASEFNAFVQIMASLPSAEDAFRDPLNIVLPEEIDILYAWIGHVVNVALKKPQAYRAEACCKLALRIAEKVEGGVEHGYLMVRMLVGNTKMRGMLMRAPSWIRVAQRWGKYLMPGPSLS